MSLTNIRRLGYYYTMKPVIITNNPRVHDEFSSKVQTEYHEGLPQEEILKIARDRIHLGAKLVIHPMMGRIRPHETPYKSVFLEVPEAPEGAAQDPSHQDEAATTAATAPLDFTSLQIIEDSMAETAKFLNNTYMKKYNEEDLKDLQYIDFLLIREGIEEYNR